MTALDHDTLIRFGTAMPAGLLADFDKLVGNRGYANRSEALRDLVRREVTEQAWEQGNGTVTGVLTLVYDHHGSVGQALMKMQHTHHEAIVCTTHIHLDAHRCMEVVVLRGPVEKVREIADHLCSARGVHNGRLMAASIDQGLDKPIHHQGAPAEVRA